MDLAGGIRVGFNHLDDRILEGIELAWSLNGFAREELLRIETQPHGAFVKAEFAGDLRSIEPL